MTTRVLSCVPLAALFILLLLNTPPWPADRLFTSTLARMQTKGTWCTARTLCGLDSSSGPTLTSRARAAFEHRRHLRWRRFSATQSWFGAAAFCGPIPRHFSVRNCSTRTRTRARTHTHAHTHTPFAESDVPHHTRKTSSLKFVLCACTHASTHTCALTSATTLLSLVGHRRPALSCDTPRFRSHDPF
jgi:hypothetical protein